MPNLTQELAQVLNRHSVDVTTGTPDFILAQYLVGCINNFAEAKSHTERHTKPSVQDVLNHDPEKQKTSRDATKE